MNRVSGNLIKFFAIAARNLTKLTHLVDDLLSSTTIERGELALNKAEFKIADVIDGCCTHLRLEGKYRITYTGDHSIRVYADQYKIDQVLVNFVNNAVKYCPESLEITIHVAKVKGATKVSVIDAGQGIAQESLAKLFERYYRAGTEHFTTGLGLGLYISSEIIKRHGGEIGVESVIGKGSSFWFTIPDAAS